MTNPIPVYLTDEQKTALTRAATGDDQRLLAVAAAVVSEQLDAAGHRGDQDPGDQDPSRTTFQALNDAWEAYRAENPNYEWMQYDKRFLNGFVYSRDVGQIVQIDHGKHTILDDHGAEIASTTDAPGRQLGLTDVESQVLVARLRYWADRLDTTILPTVESTACPWGCPPEAH